ncbi:MAG: alpha/beta fold hydrolase [Myxococcota bacterium]
MNAPIADYPFRSNYRTTPDGHRQHYVDEGAGAPVVMLHGNPTWSFYYRRLISSLVGQGFRALAPDHIGCGLSDKPGDDRYPYRLARRVEDFGGFIDHLNLPGTFDLVVHDWGGMIGFAWAVQHPERIRRLVVLNTAAFPLPKTKKMPWQLRLGRDSSLGALLVRGANAFAAGATWMAVKKPLQPEVKRGYLLPYDSWDHRIATLRFVQDIPLGPEDPGWDILTQTEANLGRLAEKPMLIAWGLKDFVFDHHFLSTWEQHFPKASVHRFEEAGHYVLEDARDAILPLVQDHLRPS